MFDLMVDWSCVFEERLVEVCVCVLGSCAMFEVGRCRVCGRVVKVC